MTEKRTKTFFGSIKRGIGILFKTIIILIVLSATFYGGMLFTISTDKSLQKIDNPDKLKTQIARVLEENISAQPIIIITPKKTVLQKLFGDETPVVHISTEEATRILAINLESKNKLASVQKWIDEGYNGVKNFASTTWTYYFK